MRDSGRYAAGRDGLPPRAELERALKAGRTVKGRMTTWFRLRRVRGSVMRDSGIPGVGVRLAGYRSGRPG